jgi:hypothetical protein
MPWHPTTPPILHAVAMALLTGWEIATTGPGEYRGFGVPVLPLSYQAVHGRSMETAERARPRTVGGSGAVKRQNQ